MLQTAVTTELIITEQYAVELTKTGRGILAEVKDAHHPMNGMYALGSNQGCALAVLRAKIQEKQGQ
jgi:hypothetical protein